jgi:glutathione S-transferase
MALHEKRVSYSLVETAPHTEEQLERHPFGKVPAFTHGDVGLFESCAIMRYVDEVFEGPHLQPSTPLGRARMNQWMSATADYLYSSAIRGLVIPKMVIARGGGEIDEQAIAQNLPTLRRHLEIFDRALADRTWLAGELLSLADILLGPILFYVQLIPEGREVVDGLGHLGAWLATIKDRRSFTASMPPLK